MTTDPKHGAAPEDESSEAEHAGVTIRPIYADELDDHIDALAHETRCPQD